jgi:ABC-type multidrug transport system ATPase subunit
LAWRAAVAAVSAARNGLDPAGILELRALIAGLVAEGRTVFVSSHLPDEIEKTCHAVGKGRATRCSCTRRH